MALPSPLPRVVLGDRHLRPRGSPSWNGTLWKLSWSCLCLSLPIIPLDVGMVVSGIHDPSDGVGRKGTKPRDVTPIIERHHHRTYVACVYGLFESPPHTGAKPCEPRPPSQQGCVGMQWHVEAKRCSRKMEGKRWIQEERRCETSAPPPPDWSIRANGKQRK